MIRLSFFVEDFWHHLSIFSSASNGMRSSKKNGTKRILRDNRILNPIIRNLVRILSKVFKPLRRFTALYRIYGVVNIEAYDVSFQVYCEADDHIANEIFYGQGYEDGEFKLIKILVEKSNIFVDVGANTGIFSIFAAKINRNLKVLSFEPHPSNYARLQKNISVNQLKNIDTFSNAIGSNDSDLTFVIPADLSISTVASSNQAFTKSHQGTDCKSILVQQRTLDQLLLNLPITSSDVLKIDVELYELEVLKGAALTLMAKRPLIVIEILHYTGVASDVAEMKNGLDDSHASKVFAFLINIGYHCYTISDNGIEYIRNIENCEHRNFLFVERRLKRDYYAYQDAAEAFE